LCIKLGMHMGREIIVANHMWIVFLGQSLKLVNCNVIGKIPLFISLGSTHFLPNSSRGAFCHFCFFH